MVSVMGNKNRRERQINVRIDDELNEAFDRAVEIEGYSKSLVIRELIKRYVKRVEQEQEQEQRGSRGSQFDV